MLKLVDIKKDYISKDNTVHALKGITTCFRDNEFVSILGPSGCGKTTLLNILGGLDHYSSGDLIIDDVSTKEYKDHDWDIYRNHKIGFIFQSYNLIPHENILENVQLALTIAGVDKKERERRAKEVLDEVGLKGLYKKMPSQLSGGQCQRVAIARALVNEPEILLADEPTGALDSETSLQIMDLLKEVAKKRLVIMVTHNPDLANKYSTRIINLLDGKLISDSMPYVEGEKEEKKMIDLESDDEDEKARMSLFTAFKLSFKNLLSKMKRTVMTVIAASIGIIGVSAVLSVSSGVTGYIDSMQDEMLSSSPVTVQESSYDLGSLMSSMTNSQKSEEIKEATKDGYVDVNFLIKNLIDTAKQMGSGMITNEITDKYLSYLDEMPKENYSAIAKYYGLDVTNNIYTNDKVNGHNDDEWYSLSAIENIAATIVSKTEYSQFSSMIDSLTNSFSQSLDDSDYILSQYDILDGKVATEENELMLILNQDDMVSDLALTLLGYYGQDEFINLIYKYTDDPKYDDSMYKNIAQMSIDSLKNKSFKYYPNDTVFTKNSDIASSMLRPYTYSYQPNSTWNNSLDMKVVGILKPKKSRQFFSLSTGFYYTPKFTKRFLNDNLNSNISRFIKEYMDKNEGAEGYTSGSIPMQDSQDPTKTNIVNYGLYYNFDMIYEGVAYKDNIAFLGKSGGLSSLLASQNGIKTATLKLSNVGGKNIPSSIEFYPKSFDKKDLVTDYLKKWNSDETLIIDGKHVTKAQRDDIDYTDNLEIIISLINTMINIVTIALICFTCLALIVSTVMIAIITYVSVMERVKEIGIIRAIGGRKKDVSRLFNAETLMIGFTSGVFGIAVTYILQIILNAIVHANFAAITSIAALPIPTALIIILISILLTTIAGLIPARSAAKKDPVVALRTE